MTLLLILVLAQAPAPALPASNFELPTSSLAPQSATFVVIQEPEAHPRVLHAALAAHMVAQFADISTTQFALGRGRYREANPVLRTVAGGPIRMAIVKGGIAVGTTALLLRNHKQHPKLVVVLAAAAATATSYAAARNARSLRTEPRR